jgi:hypothetical protein
VQAHARSWTARRRSACARTGATRLQACARGRSVRAGFADRHKRLEDEADGLFAFLDADGNGLLDAEEVARAFAGQPVIARHLAAELEARPEGFSPAAFRRSYARFGHVAHLHG